MELIINTPGTFIRKREQCFLIQNEDNKTEIACSKVQRILISTHALITSDSIQLAIENNIEIIFMDNFGIPQGKIWHPNLGSTAKIRRNQLRWYDSSKGLGIAKVITRIKLLNQRNFIQSLKRTRPSRKAEFDVVIQKIDVQKEKLDSLFGSIDENRQHILGIEGVCAKEYFKMISSVLPNQYQFSARSKHPARDPYNAMLNYGYGILYSRIETSCIIAGLDPYCGFLHTDNYNKLSLVFDIIEAFRVLVERPITFLFTKKEVEPELFDIMENNAVFLNKDGKTFFIPRINDALRKPVKWKNQNIPAEKVIQKFCYMLARCFLEDKYLDDLDHLRHLG